MGLALLMAVLAACGGSGSTSASPASATTPPTTAGSSPASAAPTPTGLPSFNNHGAKTATGSTLSLEADNYYFEPSVIRGTPGTKVTLKLENSSGTEHNFTVKRQHVDVDIDAHETKTATITIPSGGFVSFYCEYHQARGMAGVIQPS